MRQHLPSFCSAGLADLLPVPLGVRVRGGKAEGRRKAGGEAEAERRQETGKVDRKSKWTSHVLFIHFVHVCTNTTDYLSPNCLLVLHSDRAKFKKST